MNGLPELMGRSLGNDSYFEFFGTFLLDAALFFFPTAQAQKAERQRKEER